MVSPLGAPKNTLQTDMGFELYETPTCIIIDEDDGTLPPPGVTITEGGTIPPELLGPDSGNPAVLYTVEATGTWDLSVFKPAAWTVDWYCWIKVGGVLYAGSNPIPAATPSWTFTGIDFGTKGTKGEGTVVMNDNQTLPVELSSFTAVLSVTNNVILQWVTQSETNVSGYRLYRNSTNDLESATMLNTFIEATNTSQMKIYVYRDEEIYEDGTYYYWLQNLDFDGSSEFHGPISITVNVNGAGIPVIPITQGINNAYPNPFNPSTSVEIGINRPAETRVAVYNQRCQLVRILLDDYRDKGSYTLHWDGTDANNRPLPSGMYVIRMLADGKQYIHKVMLLK
jgi:hypothetical protein